MKKYIYLGIGLVLLSGIKRPAFGFVSAVNDAAIGYDIGILTSYIIGIVLIFAFFKEFRRERRNKGEKNK